MTPQSPPGGDELDKLCMDLWITDPYKVPYTDCVPAAVLTIRKHMAEAEEAIYANVLRMIEKRNKAEGDTISAAQLRRWLQKMKRQPKGE